MICNKFYFRRIIMDEKIYFKVIELFSEKGPRFTIEELARALGTSKRTIYENFKNYSLDFKYRFNWFNPFKFEIT